MPAVELPAYRGASVTVRLINTGSNIICTTKTCCQPRIKGHEVLNLPTVAFLVEHAPSSTKVLFDGGVRKGFQNFSPAGMRQLNKCVPDMHVPYDIRDVMDRTGHSMDNLKITHKANLFRRIDYMESLGSHHHWDHIGDARRFPDHCEIVVGPGFTNAHLPGWPIRRDSPLLQRDFEGKKLRELTFETDIQIGGFRAFDFWGDGSFYLLDTPGHSIGHICGLARTNEADWIFFGGYICHFAGSFRPTQDVPMPDPLPSDVQLHSHLPRPCPASIFTCCHPAGEEAGKKEPYYTVAKYDNTIYVDPELADKSIALLANFDASPNVLVAIAHDPAIAAFLPCIDQPGNEQSDIGGWRAAGFKAKCHWDFLNELPQDGMPGKSKLVEGYNCAGNEYFYDLENMMLYLK
ncbi:hypothetical protein MGN70_003081 [Eutypa lata]|nr:hypothetical protein MGN70_003081 [Eutypa lata]